MRISLVMPTWNGAATLPGVLAALADQDLRITERIAVDSGSTDGTKDLLAAAGFKVITIPQGEFNHGASRDLGISQATGEIVVLLVQDALPADRSFIRHLTRPFAKDPKLAGVYGRQTPKPGANPILAARLRNWNAGRTEAARQQATPEEYEKLAPLERLGRCAFDNVAAAIRRDIWAEIPFGRRPFGEDVAWGKRVILAGYRLLFTPAAQVVHSHDRTPMAEFKRLYCDHHNLNELFGVTLIPRFKLIRPAIRNQREIYKKVIAELPLPPDSKDKWWRWARRYARGEAFGVWLGARSYRWKVKGRFWFPLVDQLLRRGI